MPFSCAAINKVSWNIDCLNLENKFARVEEVCAIVLESEERDLPDVILLQVRARAWYDRFTGTVLGVSPQGRRQRFFAGHVAFTLLRFTGKP